MTATCNVSPASCKRRTSSWLALGALVGLLSACAGGAGGGASGSEAGGNGPGTGAGGSGNGEGGSGVVGGSAGAPESMPPGGESSVPADVGTKPVHRLSNVEYNNTVRDLLGTTLTPASAFQADSEALGFDTIADAADMNPRHVKDYFEAAQALSNDVFANPALVANIVTCQPASAGDVTCAEQIITTFGRRAFRRPLEEWEVTHYSALYQAALAIPLDHNGAIQHVVRTMLSAPQFLYRMEIDADPFSATMRPLNSYELASRLSYLLWSSMPDQALLDAAGAGTLVQLEALQAEVDRMLSDPKSSALVSNFGWQWFGAPRLASHTVDDTLFPMWNETVRASMQGELQLFLDEFMHQARPLPELLTADVNYVDANLAGIYGVAPPNAAGFTRMEITTDERKGMLGLAGFLTHTSRHNRTAPTIRAAWALEALLCMHIEPPTNIVITPLPEVDPETTSVRELLDAHRDNPACSGCHDIVDPVGLGMEQYDALGRFRAQYENGMAIDTAGVLPGDVPFTGFTDMLDKMATLPKSAEDPTLKIVSCAAEKLFTYGMGRTVAPSQAYLDQLVTFWEGQPLTMNNLVKQLVVNDVFRFRRGSPEM